MQPPRSLLDCSRPLVGRSARRSAVGAVLLFVMAALPGCTAGFTSSTVEDFGTFRIDVTNDLAPRVEVFLQVDPQEGGEAGSEISLGSAPVEGTTVFRVDLEDLSSPHRLRAALPRNQELLSETFVPRDLGGVLWILADNVLERGDSGPPPESDSEMSRRETGVVGRVHRRPTGARVIPPRR